MNRIDGVGGDILLSSSQRRLGHLVGDILRAACA